MVTLDTVVSLAIVDQEFLDIQESAATLVSPDILVTAEFLDTQVTRVSADSVVILELAVGVVTAVSVVTLALRDIQVTLDFLVTPDLPDTVATPEYQVIQEVVCQVIAVTPEYRVTVDGQELADTLEVECQVR